MNIDLSRALNYAGNDIKNRAHLKAILSDMYPDDIQDINVILMLYESGIPAQIMTAKDIDERTYSLYVERIVREYGLNDALACDALNAWVDAFLGDGYSGRFAIKKPQTEERTERRIERTGTPQRDKGSVHNVDNLEYEVRTIDGNEVELALYWGGSSNILIPGVIEGQKVGGIGSEAFMRRQSVVKAKIQEGIRYTGDSAFRNCVNLECVTFPATMESIGQECFRNCEALSEVHLGDGLRQIKDKAFFNCPSLTKILIPPTLETIGDRVFSKNMQSSLVIYCDTGSYPFETFTSMGFRVEDSEEYEIYL